MPENIDDENDDLDDLDELKKNMVDFLRQDNPDGETYEETIGMQVAGANWDGDIAFLQKMADTGQFDPLSTIEPETWNYLHRANLINPSPAKTIRFYLDKGVAVNAQDIYGMTPLHYAMDAQNPEAALVLLEAGADPNIPNGDNVIPLAMIGGMPQRLDVLEMMLKKGGNVHYLNSSHEIGILEVIKKYCSDQEEFKPIIKLMEKYG